MKTFPNLRGIVFIGAGIDHVLCDPDLPKAIPIIRTTGRDLSLRMREYVTLHVLRLHRRLPEVEAVQSQREWLQIVEPPANERRVGIMGLGNLGADCAYTWTKIGFEVAGWWGARIAENIRAFNKGEYLTNLVLLGRGYRLNF